MMNTAVASTERILAFDGDCPMCRRTIAILLRAGLVKPWQARSHRELAGDDLEAVRAAGIRNQLVVLDPRTRETRSGTDGLVWIIGDNRGNPVWVRLLALPGVRHLLRWGYETISYNRRVISPPRHQIVCDCEPEVTFARRMMLAFPAAGAALLLAALFGAAAFRGCELGSARSGAAIVAAAVGLAFGAMALAALATLRGSQRIDYLAHLAITLLAGTLSLLPAAVLSLVLPRAGSIGLVAASLASSAVLMFAMHRRRVAAAGLSNRWPAGFAAALSGGIGAAAWVYWQYLAA